MQKISETARGRWHGILPQLGVNPKFLENRHGPCPLCGGNDRFRFDDKGGRGTWICNRCGSGDGAELVKRLANVDFKEAARMVEGVVGTVGRRPERPETSRVDLGGVWDAASPIKPGSPVGNYLANRCGWTENYSENLRESGDIMLAKVQHWNGEGVNIHRTWIKSRDRKLMPGKLPPASAIRLTYAYPGTEMGVAEGIETALSAQKLFDIPCWSLINAVMMKKWRPPMAIKKVVIFGDNDESFAGQAAAYELAYNLRDDVEVEVKIPSIPGWDWNDVQRNNDRNL